MSLLAPDILEEARGLPVLLTAGGLALGLFLWLFGARTHRFWAAMVLALAAGAWGLVYGRDYGVQPLVAGLLLAVAAGALALSLVRVLLFVAGGVAALALVQAVAPGWNEPLVCFLSGGLAGVFLYRLWIMTLSSLTGTLLAGHCVLALADRLARFDSVAWAQKNGPLLNWGCAALTALGMLTQFLLERRRRRVRREQEQARKGEEKPAPPPPPPAPAPKSPWWKFPQGLLWRQAG